MSTCRFGIRAQACFVLPLRPPSTSLFLTHITRTLRRTHICTHSLICTHSVCLRLAYWHTAPIACTQFPLSTSVFWCVDWISFCALVYITSTFPLSCSYSGIASVSRNIYVLRDLGFSRLPFFAGLGTTSNLPIRTTSDSPLLNTHTRITDTTSFSSSFSRSSVLSFSPLFPPSVLYVSTISLPLLCYFSTISLLSVCLSAISVLSLFYLSAISLLSLCYLFAISLLSLFYLSTISLLSLFHLSSISLLSLYYMSVSLLSLYHISTISSPSLCTISPLSLSTISLPSP